MATITPTAYTPVGAQTSGAVVGQAAGWTAVGGAGDKIALVGSAVVLGFKTAGTACTVTMDSVVLSSYGTDVNTTVVLAATDEQELLVLVDNRFRGVGADAGLLNLTYSATTSVTLRAKYIA